MTGDSIAITVSAFLFFAWLALWAAWRMLRPRARREFIYATSPDGKPIRGDLEVRGSQF